MNHATVNGLDPTAGVVPGRGFNPAALGALFVLTLRQHLRGRRFLVLALLFLLPSALALLLQLAPQPPEPEQLEFGFVLNLIPRALATLTALLYAGGMIQDEVEEQTLTYLLLRPLPRWALYVTKFAATLVVTILLTCTFTVLVEAVSYRQSTQLWDEILPDRALKIAGIMALTQVTYCSIFGAISLYTRRALIGGLVYIVLVEGLLASFRAVTQKLTVVYYFRVLSVHWLELTGQRTWDIDLRAAPSAAACVWTLLLASAVFVAFGALMMTRQEFRMKTPEGS